MRCLALAQAWLESDRGDVSLVGRIESPGLQKRLEAEGVHYIPLHEPCNSSDEVALFRGLFTESGEGQPGWIVLDGYHFNFEYQQAIRKIGYNLLVVDDIGHNLSYDADILLNQNINAENIHYDVVGDTVLLMGTKYALLRKKFRMLGVGEKDIPQRARRILVTLGGADPENATLFIIKSLKSAGLIDVEVRVVMGYSNPHHAEIEQELADAKFAYELLWPVHDMPLLLNWADLALSAGGSTCWELCYLGVPALLVIQVENQEALVSGLENADAAVNCGWFHSLTEAALVEKILWLVYDSTKRLELSGYAKSLVDGKGVERVLEQMSPSELHLRKAEWSDCKMIFKWANDPQVRADSFHSEAIPWDIHTNWFRTKLQESESRMFIVSKGAWENIGLVRCDKEGDSAVLSVNVDKKYRNLGFGSRMIRYACELVLAEKLVNTIDALIKNDNKISARAFAKAGFVKVKTLEQQGTSALLMRFRDGVANDTR